VTILDDLHHPHADHARTRLHHLHQPATQPAALADAARWLPAKAGRGGPQEALQEG
jgi:hypothetical protein